MTKPFQVKQRPDKGLSWWAFFRFAIAHEAACRALSRLNRLAKLTGALGVEIQSGIAEHGLRHEYAADRESWVFRKAYGAYERRGVQIPLACLEAELRHAEILEKAVEK